jgi:hypothetical protein
MVPIKRKRVFNAGVPNKVPRNNIPPETVNNPQSRIMKGI